MRLFLKKVIWRRLRFSSDADIVRLTNARIIIIIIIIIICRSHDVSTVYLVVRNIGDMIEVYEILTGKYHPTLPVT